MGPALEYASSIWSPLASSTSINKLQVMLNKTQTYNICMTKHSHFPYTSTYSSTPHNTNTTSITSSTQTHNIPQHSKAKNTIFNNGRYTVTTSDTKPNMHHIHTCFVSRHLATICNNKILCIPPTHISSSEEILPPRTLAQLRTFKSPFLKSYLHIVHANSPTSPLYPHMHHIVPPGFVGRPYWSDGMERLARWRDTLADGPKAG